MKQQMMQTQPVRSMTGIEALQTLALWSPFVIALRMPVLLAETAMFSASDRTETNRLVGEKVGAFVEGMVAVQFATVAAMIGFADEAARMRFDLGSVSRAAEQILKAGLDPSAERVRENAERLSLAVA